MSCTCTQNFTGTAADLFNTMKTEIENNHGTITGDATSGTFTVPTPLGTVGGSYSIDGETIKVEITNKPAILGCHTICNFISSHITS